jgi:hypothetical protein
MGNVRPVGDPYEFGARGLVGYGSDGSGSRSPFGYPLMDPACGTLPSRRIVYFRP